MQKIPTLFVRNPDDRRHVLNEVTPGCEWVMAGEGVPTRKYDGTCVMFDGTSWWARREVKPGKTPPPNYMAISTDDATGKTVGWEPIEQSAFAKYHAEAAAYEHGALQHPAPGEHWEYPAKPYAGTYELLGPKINGNPEGVDFHGLVRHGYIAAEDQWEMEKLARTFGGFREWLHAHPKWEGLVFHHGDGRVAKIKRRDFADS